MVRSTLLRQATYCALTTSLSQGILSSGMTDKCEYCGDSLGDDWVACPKCGKPKYGGKPLIEIPSREKKPPA